MPRIFRDIASERLANQQLLQPRLELPEAIVATLGAVQAQDYQGALWAVAQRSSAVLTEGDVDRAVAEGRVLRTHVLRPTWHFVVPADIRWMLALTGPRVKRAMASYDRKLGLTPEVYRKTNRALERALSGGQSLTRAELKLVLEKAGIETSVQRTAHVMMNAELDALITSGPRRGKQFTYALMDERVPATNERSRDESLHELALRYFRTRGPATVRDFAWWSGLTAADARLAVDLAGAHVASEEIDGARYHFAHDSQAVASGETRAWLLPNYDEYFIGFKDRSAIGLLLKGVVTATVTATLFTHVVAVDGQLIGGWRRMIDRDAVTVEVRPLTRLTKQGKEAVERAVEDYGHYLEQPVKLRYTRTT